ncbi:MAG: hypothetical protein ABIO46_04455 [Chitinophagales bacterium]
MRNLQEKYFPVIEEWLDSGLSAKAFSEQNGINKNTLSYWKKRYSDQNKVQHKGFASLSVTDIQAKQISIEYADGTRLTFSDTVNASVLKSLIPVFNS